MKITLKKLIINLLIIVISVTILSIHYVGKFKNNLNIYDEDYEIHKNAEIIINEDDTINVKDTYKLRFSNNATVEARLYFDLKGALSRDRTIEKVEIDGRELQKSEYMTAAGNFIKVLDYTFFKNNHTIIVEYKYEPNEIFYTYNDYTIFKIARNHYTTTNYKITLPQNTEFFNILKVKEKNDIIKISSNVYQINNLQSSRYNNYIDIAFDNDIIKNTTTVNEKYDKSIF